MTTKGTEVTTKGTEMTAATRPEIGHSIRTGNFLTNYHDEGAGMPVVLMHGSGPGVTAWANWQLVIPKLSPTRRVIAPDLVGFGYTERPEGVHYHLDTWTKQVLDLIDAVELEKVDLVGNSFGGALALRLAIDYPDRINRIVLMGSAGISFPLTEGLDAVWGYTPSLESMAREISLFVDNKALATENLIEMRYRASIQPGFQEAFSAMFPEPRQECIEWLASDEADIRRIPHQTLIVHGREDQVIPLESSYRLFQLIDQAQLHVFGHCGHWTQIEQNARFCRLVADFLSE